MRKINFHNHEYYHIYNRGVDKRKVFCDERDYMRFLNGMYRTRLSLQGRLSLVRIIAYCLINNHYHFMLEQLIDNGISTFMHKLGTGYTMYFNRKYTRSGSLFQGPFKSIHINSNNYFLWLSGYINGNPEIHKIFKAKSYPRSSYQYYLGKTENNICNKNIILDQFKNIKEYQNYVEMIIKEAKKRKDGAREYRLE